MSAQAATQVIEAGEGAITPGAAAVERAARVLAAGGLVAFPTETVYGLGADATNAAAVARLYDAKGRPSFNPLIAHVPTTAQHVLADLRGRIELIVDGGPTPMGLESTIVACLDRPVLLRPGALPRV